MMGNAQAVLGGQPTRAIFINQVPKGITYEDIFDAVGAFGNLESVKLLADKRQAFVNFIDAADAFRLMSQLGGAHGSRVFAACHRFEATTPKKWLLAVVLAQRGVYH